MRDLLKNKRKLWYANYIGKERAVDDNGDFTGEWIPQYTAPVRFDASVSPTRGTQGFTGTGASYDIFGADLKYQRVVSTARKDIVLNEYSLLWDKEPETDDQGNVLYEKAPFKIVAVAPGLYQMKYAIVATQQKGVQE